MYYYNFTNPFRSSPIKIPFSILNNNNIPRNGLLVYLKRPNSDGYITPEDSEIPENEINWGYVLPQSLFPIIGSGLFFQGDGTPIVVIASDIMSYPTINTQNILFNNLTRRLAVYDPSISNDVLDEAKWALKIF